MGPVERALAKYTAEREALRAEYGGLSPEEYHQLTVMLGGVPYGSSRIPPGCLDDETIRSRILAGSTDNVLRRYLRFVEGGQGINRSDRLVALTLAEFARRGLTP